MTWLRAGPVVPSTLAVVPLRRATIVSTARLKAGSVTGMVGFVTTTVMVSAATADAPALIARAPARASVSEPLRPPVAATVRIPPSARLTAKKPIVSTNHRPKTGQR